MIPDTTQPLDLCEHEITIDDLNIDQSDLPLICTKCNEPVELVASKDLERLRAAERLLHDMAAYKTALEGELAALRSPRPSPADLREKIEGIIMERDLYPEDKAEQILALLAAPVSPAEGCDGRCASAEQLRALCHGLQINDVDKFMEQPSAVFFDVGLFIAARAGDTEAARNANNRIVEKIIGESIKEANEEGGSNARGD